MKVKYIITLTIYFGILLSYNCNDAPKESDSETIKMAKLYCGSCHEYPEPELLDKQTWKKAVLPRMGNMMGIYSSHDERMTLIETPESENTFPKEATIELGIWKRIQQYYLDHAPDSLEKIKVNINFTQERFKVLSPEFKVSPPSSTLVKYMDDGGIFIGDALSKKLMNFDANLELTKAGNLMEGVVHIEEDENDMWILAMGSFSPSDIPSGVLLNMPKTENRQARIIADKLRRPVHASYGDLNNDGHLDIVISEFAKWTGRLSILYGKGNKRFDYEILHNQTGSTKTILKDFDGDGKLDIMALFAQGREGISIFYNKGGNKFNQKEILSFPPSNGSTSFEVFDLEQDGDWDILYTAGDNADYIPILKPYHGVYIFENEGEDTYTQFSFYPINGSNGAKIGDFDLDQDLDIAVISFFPDFNNEAQESFVYLENDGNFNFDAYSFPNNSRGRWIVMDAKDRDNDGDLDLILGSLAFETIPDNGYVKKWIKDGLPYLVLENQTIN